MIALLNVEMRKLGGSLALLLAVLAPALPGVLAALAIATSTRTTTWWEILGRFVLPIWALFLLPMVVAAFTTLVAQIEYRSRGWDHLLALPLARWRVFTAKAFVVLAAVVLMTLLVLGFAFVGASLGGAIGGNPPTGALPWAGLAKVVPLLLAAAALLTGLQLWVALRFSNFVVPLGVGIAGTLVALAVAMTGTDQADWFPWVLPFKVLTAPDPVPAAIVGGLGGMVVLVAMIVDLSRRSFR